MRRALLPAVGVLLVGPTVLAFFAGGYFEGSRATAAAVAWALVLLLAVAGPLPLPRSAPGWVALAGLVGLGAWSAASIAWAPLFGPAIDSVQRVLLYIAVLLAAIALLRDRLAARAVEPVLALGALVVIAYGLSARLLPDLIEFRPSFGAGARLEQPITYWNAEGLLAAMGLVLCARIAGDRSRAPLMRALAAAGCAPLGLGTYLSYSRGAIAAAVMGLVVLVALCPVRPQLRAAVSAVLSAVVASAGTVAFHSVASVSGSAADQRRDGAGMLGLLLLIMLAAGLGAVWAARAEQRDPARVGRLGYAGRIPAVAAVAVTLCLAGLVVGGLGEDAGPAGPSRLASVSSQRYEYWRVGLNAFLDEPVQGVGAGGFRVLWRMERRVDTSVLEVHSLVLGMAVELGIPGLLFLGLLVGGVAAAGRRAHRQDASLAAGACAATTVWFLHATIDWDWQVPAVTLPAVVLAGGLLAMSESSSTRPAAPPVPVSSRDPETVEPETPVRVSS